MEERGKLWECRYTEEAYPSRLRPYGDMPKIL